MDERSAENASIASSNRSVMRRGLVMGLPSVPLSRLGWLRRLAAMVESYTGCSLPSMLYLPYRMECHRILPLAASLNRV
jgi:hypothetical protein